MNNSLVLQTSRAQLGPASIAGGMLLSGGSTAALILVGAASVTAVIPITGLVIGLALCVFGLILNQQTKRVHPISLDVPVEILSSHPIRSERPPLVAQITPPPAGLSFQQKATIGLALLFAGYGLAKWMSSATPASNPPPGSLGSQSTLRDICSIRSFAFLDRFCPLNPEPPHRFDQQATRLNGSVSSFPNDPSCLTLNISQYPISNPSLPLLIQDLAATQNLTLLNDSSSNRTNHSAASHFPLLQTDLSRLNHTQEISSSSIPNREDESSVFVKVQAVVYGLGLLSQAVSSYAGEIWQKVSALFQEFSSPSPEKKAASDGRSSQAAPPSGSNPPRPPSSPKRPLHIGGLSSGSHQLVSPPRASASIHIERNRFGQGNLRGGLPPDVLEQLQALSLGFRRNQRSVESPQPTLVSPQSQTRSRTNDLRGTDPTRPPRRLRINRLRSPHSPPSRSTFTRDASTEDRSLTLGGDGRRTIYLPNSREGATSFAFVVPPDLITQLFTRLGMYGSAFSEARSAQDQSLALGRRHQDAIDPLALQAFMFRLGNARILLVIDALRSQAFVILQQIGRVVRRAAIQAPTAEPLSQSPNLVISPVPRATRLGLLTEPSFIPLLRSIWSRTLTQNFGAQTSERALMPPRSSAAHTSERSLVAGHGRVGSSFAIRHAMALFSAALLQRQWTQGRNAIRAQDSGASPSAARALMPKRYANAPIPRFLMPRDERINFFARRQLAFARWLANFQRLLAGQAMPSQSSSRRALQPPALVRSDSALALPGYPLLTQGGRPYSLHRAGSGHRRRNTPLPAVVTMIRGSGNGFGMAPYSQHGPNLLIMSQSIAALDRLSQQGQVALRRDSIASEREASLIPSSGPLITTADYYLFLNQLAARVTNPPSLSYDEFVQLLGSGQLILWLQNALHPRLPSPED